MGEFYELRFDGIPRLVWCGGSSGIIGRLDCSADQFHRRDASLRSGLRNGQQVFALQKLLSGKLYPRHRYSDAFLLIHARASGQQVSDVEARECHLGRCLLSEGFTF